MKHVQSSVQWKKKVLAFTLESPNLEINLGKVHKAFIDTIYQVAENKVTLLCSNNRSTPVPDVIWEVKDFQENDLDH